MGQNDSCLEMFSLPLSICKFVGELELGKMLVIHLFWGVGCATTPFRAENEQKNQMSDAAAWTAGYFLLDHELVFAFGLSSFPAIISWREKVSFGMLPLPVILGNEGL